MRVIFFVIFVSVLQVDAKLAEERISGIFEALGYSPSCIAAALTVCEENFGSDKMLETMNNLTTLFSNKLYKGGNESIRSRNCADLYALGDSVSGVQTLYPFDCCQNKPVTVFCDQITDGGGWTVIQRRNTLPHRENFYRTWVEYVLGFGNLTGEFWLGLDNIHALVSSTLMELRVDLEDFDENKRWAKYRSFHISDSSSQYALSIAGYTGDAGDGFGSGRHNGHKFTTHDRDNDIYEPDNCGTLYRGGWWYDKCHILNLNGFQYEREHSSYADGINWEPWKGYRYSLKWSEMKIRPAFKNT